MKSLEARQAERAQRRADEDKARKASGLEATTHPLGEGVEGDDETDAETGKPKRGKGKAATDAQAGNGGGAGATGGANPFGNS
jgi:hypothetical protein